MCIKNLSDKDPKYIVADEHIGQSISLIFCDQQIFDYIENPEATSIQKTNQTSKLI